MATKKKATKTVTKSAKKAPKKSAKKGMSTATKVELGAAALAAAGAAAAAGYYFYGTAKAGKHRAAAAKWAKGLQKDVQKGVKALKKVDASTVARVVDDAAAAYQGVRGVAATDVHAAAKELKSNWKQVARELAPSATVKKTVATATKSVKKAVATAKRR